MNLIQNKYLYKILILNYLKNGRNMPMYNFLSNITDGSFYLNLDKIFHLKNKFAGLPTQIFDKVSSEKI